VLTDLDVPGGIYKNVATLQLSVLQLKSFEIHKSVNNLERHQRLSAQRRQEGGWCTCPSIDAKRISFSNGFPAISESESGMNSNAAKAFPLNVKKRRALTNWACCIFRMLLKHISRDESTKVFTATTGLSAGVGVLISATIK
jgi:hypothetical protein